MLFGIIQHLIKLLLCFDELPLKDFVHKKVLFGQSSKRRCKIHLFVKCLNNFLHFAQKVYNMV